MMVTIEGRGYRDLTRKDDGDREQSAMPIA